MNRHNVWGILMFIVILGIGITLILTSSDQANSGLSEGEYNRQFCEESCEGMNTTLTEIRTTYGTSLECICVVSE